MQTIKATFDNTQEAETAVDQLLAHGFSRSRVHLQHGVAAVTTAGVDSAGSDHARSAVSGVGPLLYRLIGWSDPVNARVQSACMPPKSSVVAVDTDNDSEIETVTALMNRMGSFDV